MSAFGGLPYTDRLGNEIYPDFRNMLAMEDISESGEIDELGKSLACLKLLYGEETPQDMSAAFAELAWFYYRGEELEKPKGRVKQLFDFKQDAPFITSDFQTFYGIDLDDDDLHIHWWRFMSLFIGLSDDSQTKKRMCDRGIDTKKMKGETRKYYEARKKAVALKSKTEKSTNSPKDLLAEKQRRIDEMYAQMERDKAARGIQ